MTRFNIKKFHVVPTLRLCVLYGSQNKQQLLPYKTLRDWFLYPKWRVFTVRYALSPYIKQIRFVFKGLVNQFVLILHFHFTLDLFDTPLPPPQTHTHTHTHTHISTLLDIFVTPITYQFHLGRIIGTLLYTRWLMGRIDQWTLVAHIVMKNLCMYRPDYCLLGFPPSSGWMNTLICTTCTWYTLRHYRKFEI
jgi:hypothetical protein